MTLPRGLRNCNPGNIEDGRFAQRQLGYAGREAAGRFATFATMAHGLAALMRLLRVYRHQHGLASVRGIINRWAPPAENHTSAYVAAAARWLGVQPDDELPDSRDTYHRLAQAIARHENGPPADEITPADYAGALAIAFADLVASAPHYAPLGAQHAVTPPAPHAAAPPPLAQPGPHVVTPPAPHAAAAPPLVSAVRWPFTPAPAVPAASITEVTAMAPFIAAALPLLTQVAPALIRIFGKGEQSERNAQAAEIVAEVAKAATGQPTIEQAVQAIQTDPAAAQAFRDGVQERWYELTESGGGGIAGAREHAAQLQADRPAWANPALWISAALLPLVYLVVARVLFADGFTDEIRIMVVTAVVSGVLGSLTGFWLGSAFTTSRSRGMGAERGAA